MANCSFAIRPPVFLAVEQQVDYPSYPKRVSRTFTPLLVSKDTPSSASNSPGGAPGLCALQVMGLRINLGQDPSSMYPGRLSRLHICTERLEPCFMLQQRVHCCIPSV